MCGTINKVTDAVSKVTDSTAFKVIMPVQALAQGATTLASKAVSGGNGLTSGEQYALGAGGGAAIAGGAALMGGAGAAGAGGAGATAGVNGVTSAVAGTAGANGLGTMAASGGIPLITKILLGASVASTVAGFFGKKPGQEYQDWVNGLSAQEQASVQQLQDNLTQIQGSVDAKQTALGHMVDNYPSIVNEELTKIKSGPLAASMDQQDQAFLNHASDTLAAKYAARGGFSSGGFNSALATTADLRLSDRNQTMIDMATKNADRRLQDAQAQLDFQKKMLGVPVVDIFNARQAALSTVSGAKGTVAGINASADASKADSLGRIGGTLANAAVNLYGFDKLSGAMNVPRYMSPGANTGAGGTGVMTRPPMMPPTNDAFAGVPA